MAVGGTQTRRGALLEAIRRAESPKAADLLTKRLRALDDKLTRDYSDTCGC